MREMRTGKHELGRVLALTALLTISTLAGAEDVQHLSITQPGGMPGWPVMTGIEHTNNVAKLTWDGPSGYYQLYSRPNLVGSAWQKFGSPNLNRATNITTLQSNLFFRVSGPSPQYAGSQTCSECHPSVHSAESNTKHAQALETLKQIHQDKNPSCLPCHTVGYGLPTGFISEAATPRLAGVQCENCHGPAANHAANEMDLVARPRRDIAAQVCGGCHNGSHQPTFAEWSSSGHSVVVEDMNPPSRINSCGRCHSGTARLAMVYGVPASTIATTLTNDANVAITCAVCHDPHSQHVWTNVLTGMVLTNQLRYPTASTNYFSLTTSSTFTNRYDINVCAQCHNDRGASWTSSSRPPHHSPQYNMLMGSVGVLANGGNAATNNQPASHATLVTNQCVSCHMPTREYESEASPAVTGHSFQVTAFESCLACHPTDPEGLVALVQDQVIKPLMQEVLVSLDRWATNSSPLVLRTNYGVLAWEYTTPGDLSTGASGPTTAEQALIPDPIKQARFNLYIVNNDGSFGVHNALYSLDLLGAALAWVQSQINQ
jgi:hypothetical protein